jgi:hypothetical protein
MQRPRKPPAEPKESPVEKLLQWVHSRPAMAALLLIGVVAGFVLLIAVIWNLGRGLDRGPVTKPEPAFGRGRAPGGPKAVQPGGQKPAQPGGK